MVNPLPLSRARVIDYAETPCDLFGHSAPREGENTCPDCGMILFPVVE